jgi:hypothetical protein
MNEEKLQQGEPVTLFPHHPDCEFTIYIMGVGEYTVPDCDLDIYVYQIKGEARISFVDGKNEILNEGECAVLAPHSRALIERPKGSIVMVVWQDPRGNRG